MKAKALLVQPIPIVILIATVGLYAPRADSGAGASGERFSQVASSPVAAVEPEIRVHGATPDLERQLLAALDRFAAAGMRLPALDITFHGGRAGCDGNAGLFAVTQGTADIEICNPTNHLILHELAHAWVATHVTLETKNTLIRYWGLETWNDQGVEWGSRANERAAEAVAFGLGTLPAEPSPSLVGYLCAYQLLTGQPPSVEVECVTS